ANATDQQVTLHSLLADCWHRIQGNKPEKDTKVHPSALLQLIAGDYEENGLKLQDDDFALAKALLEHGASPNRQDEGGLTPLHWACLHNYPKTVQQLLEHGAD